MNVLFTILTICVLVASLLVTLIVLLHPLDDLKNDEITEKREK